MILEVAPQRRKYNPRYSLNPEVQKRRIKAATASMRLGVALICIAIITLLFALSH